MPTLLVIDDEPAIRFSIVQVFDGTDIRVIAAENAAQANQKVAEESPDVILLDIRLGDDDGLKLFAELRSSDPKSLIIFITGHGTSETAIEAMKRGAFDYLVKPLDARQIVEVVTKACEIRRLTRTPALVEGADDRLDNPDLIIGSSQSMRAVFKQIGRVASQDVNVLILGESGTGKELVARALYHHSRRTQQPFLAINCAALSETILESELFGHERGAFTGADRQRVGKFEQANGGTIFLDEVGDMSPNTQAKILRLLQDGTFERVGGNESLRSDVRVIAATNKPLEAMVQRNEFRLDLYYRLRGVTIDLPPLRDRPEDIPELAHYFLFRFRRELGVPVTSIAEETLECLRQYAWPGNIREFQAILREAMIRSAGSVLLPEFLPQHVSKVAPAPASSSFSNAWTWESLAAQVEQDLDEGLRGVYRRALDQFERILFVEALARTRGNQAAASELLGISRPTLRSKLRNLGIGADSADGTHTEKRANPEQ